MYQSLTEKGCNNKVNNNVLEIPENQNIVVDSIKENSEKINSGEQENIKFLVDVSSVLVYVDEECCYQNMIITGHDFSGDTVWSYTTSSRYNKGDCVEI